MEVHALRHMRHELRPKLTRGERGLMYTWMVLQFVALPVALVLLILGGALRVPGFVLLVLTLVIYAVPLSPILRARIRRRERAAQEAAPSS